MEVVEAIIEEKLTRVKLGERKLEEASEEKITGEKTKSVPVHLRRALHARASGQCEFRDQKTKKLSPGPCFCSDLVIRGCPLDSIAFVIK